MEDEGVTSAFGRHLAWTEHGDPQQLAPPRTPLNSPHTHTTCPTCWDEQHAPSHGVQSIHQRLGVIRDAITPGAKVGLQIVGDSWQGQGVALLVASHAPFVPDAVRRPPQLTLYRQPVVMTTHALSTHAKHVQQCGGVHNSEQLAILCMWLLPCAVWLHCTGPMKSANARADSCGFA
jgi:hypothetical protein